MRPKNCKPDYERTWLTAYPGWCRGLIVIGQHCMWVQITHDEVQVRPHFPVSIFGIPELLGLGWAFNKQDIVRTEKTPLGVRVRFKGRLFEREFVIYVGDKDKFIAAINA